MLLKHCDEKTAKVASAAFYIPMTVWFYDLPERDEDTAYVISISPFKFNSTEMIHLLFNQISPLITQLDVMLALDSMKFLNTSS